MATECDQKEVENMATSINTLHPAAVIDNGSYMIKAGFAGEEKPRAIFPTKVGYEAEQTDINKISGKPKRRRKRTVSIGNDIISSDVSAALLNELNAYSNDNDSNDSIMNMSMTDTSSSMSMSSNGSITSNNSNNSNATNSNNATNNSNNNSKNGKNGKNSNDKSKSVSNSKRKSSDKKNSVEIKYSYPISKEFELVTNWNDLELIWQHTFTKQLGIDCKEYSVLMTEKPLNSNMNREKMTTIMFEKFDVPSFYVANQCVLSLYGTGRTTGVVVDMGYNTCYITPIYHGFCLPHSVFRLQLGGKDISKLLQKNVLNLLHQNNNKNNKREWINIIRQSQMNGNISQYVRNIKERLCYVSLDYQNELLQRQLQGANVVNQVTTLTSISASAAMATAATAVTTTNGDVSGSGNGNDSGNGNGVTTTSLIDMNDPTNGDASGDNNTNGVVNEIVNELPERQKTYVLPDGQKIEFDKELYDCCEILFDPSKLSNNKNYYHISQSSTGIDKLVFKSISESHCDSKLQKDFYKNIVLSGGTSLLTGMKQRLEKEITSLAPLNMKNNVHIIALPDRQYSVFNGASILTSLNTFKQMCITSKEYFEYGAQIVHRKCT